MLSRTPSRQVMELSSSWGADAGLLTALASCSDTARHFKSRECDVVQEKWHFSVTPLNSPTTRKNDSSQVLRPVRYPMICGSVASTGCGIFSVTGCGLTHISTTAARTPTAPQSHHKV